MVCSIQKQIWRGGAKPSKSNQIQMAANCISGADAAEPDRLPIREPQAARAAHFVSGQMERLLALGIFRILSA